MKLAIRARHLFRIITHLRVYDNCKSIGSQNCETLNQCGKRNILITKRDDMCIIITNKGLVLNVQHEQDDEQLHGFDTMIMLEKEEATLTLTPTLI